MKFFWIFGFEDVKYRANDYFWAEKGILRTYSHFLGPVWIKRLRINYPLYAMTTLPAGYAVAYVSPFSAHAVLYPIPLHLAVRFLYWVRQKLEYYEPTKIDKAMMAVIKKNTHHAFVDGDHLCIVGSDFKNLQESECIFIPLSNIEGMTLTEEGQS